MNHLFYQTENFGKSYDFRPKLHEGFVIGAHIHEFSEIIYVLSGDAEIVINGKTLHLKDDDFVFIPPNYIHQYKIDKAKVYCAVFSNDYIPLFFNAIGDRHLNVEPINVAKHRDLLEKIFTHDSSSKMLTSGYLNILCDIVLKNSELSPSVLSDGILYQKVINYIFKHFTEDITLKDVSQKFGYNEKYLSATLHKLTGINFRKFISLYRVLRAKELLLNSKEDISSIAMSCGFSAINTFNRTFKEFTGFTPTEFKKQSKIN
jgi:AraC-like DNA-binding protein